MKLVKPQTLNTFRFRLPVLAAVIAAASPLVLAQDAGWYVGLGAGKSWADINTGAVVTSLHNAGYNSSVLSTYDDDIAGKLFGGYRFSRNFALEGGYFDLGSFNYGATVVPAATQNGRGSVSGMSLDLVGTLPIQDTISAFARLGLASARVSQTFSNPLMGAGFADHKNSGTHAHYGAGLEYIVSDAVSVRAELERFRIESNSVVADSVTALTVSVAYHFGGSKSAPAPATSPVVATPPPPPAPAPVPAPRAPVKITLAASALFDFDRIELKAIGRQELDKLVRDLKGVRYDVIIVTGHTDRIGTHAYNLALSERRARAVREYLVSAGVPSGNITARGVNSDQSVTTAQQCQGRAADALKACLQPDRRVEVEVSGTRAP